MGMEQLQAKVKSDREVAHAKQMQQHQAQIRAAQIAAQQRAIQQMQQVGPGRFLGWAVLTCSWASSGRT